MKIESGRPVLNENIEHLIDDNGQKSLIIIKRVEDMPDGRSWLMKWLVPRRKGIRRLRLDQYGTMLVQLISGKRSTKEVVREMIAKTGAEQEEARTACLMFLRALGRRGVISIIEN